jgi:hypothetical protein
MTVPPKERWFDDHEPSEVFEFGEYLVTQDEIIYFARRYDPQPFIWIRWWLVAPFTVT